MQEHKQYSDPMDYFLSVTGGRWKLIIIFSLSRAESGVLRYGQLKRCLNGVTDKMLSTQLKELEQDGILLRKQYEQIPPKVEYRLTEKGRSLLPIIHSMHRWGYEVMRSEHIPVNPEKPSLTSLYTQAHVQPDHP